MREPAIAQQLVRAVVNAVPANIPVTVKHRAGWNPTNLNAPEFADALVEAGAKMITVHGRTRTQGFSGKSDPDIIFIPAPSGSDGSGTYVAFKRVERDRDGKTYVLQSGGSLTAFGAWPALPSNLPTPTASDGYPTFVPAGRDDSGLEIFAPSGDSPDKGFAVPPATAGADPAAGNPNWTWWLPKKTL
jgi:hypothetical protein